MKTENAKGVKCPRCGNEHVVMKETKRPNGTVSTKYYCRNSVCMYKFTPTILKASVKGTKHVTGRTSVDIDKTREAKQPGKRTVKHLDDDGKLVSTTTYYERRRNRADIDLKRRL